MTDELNGQDTLEDTVEDTAEDTVEDIVEDIVEDTVEDTAEDAAEDTAESAGNGEDQDASFDLASAGVDVMLRFFVGILGQLAWRSLGLVANPGTGEVKLDLAEARMAIDVMGDVLKRLSPTLTDIEARELNNLLTNLRLNYADKSKVESQETQEG